MRFTRFFVVLGLLFAPVVHSATVSFDFEGLDRARYATITEDGFQLSGDFEVVLNPTRAVNRPDLGATLVNLSGQPFGLTSFDAGQIFFGAPPLLFEVTGTYAGGGTISGAWQIDTNPSTIVVGPGWDNLVSVTFERTPGEGLDSAFYLSGIELTVVPIPAAVWLMLSALGSLGWLSRRA